MSYKGDVTVEETWTALEQNGNAFLVDVRTQPEWAFVGICNLDGLNKSPLLVSWLDYPQMEVNGAFVDVVAGQDMPKDASLYFLCRSGVRSKAAAAAMTVAGFENCFNILGGFEGGPDDAGHRGVTGGWKAAGLPWSQK